VVVQTDEDLARMLQAEENSNGRGLPIEQRPVFFARAGMRVSPLSYPTGDLYAYASEIWVSSSYLLFVL